eukprot:g4247.t1
MSLPLLDALSGLPLPYSFDKKWMTLDVVNLSNVLEQIENQYDAIDILTSSQDFVLILIDTSILENQESRILNSIIEHYSVIMKSSTIVSRDSVRSLLGTIWIKARRLVAKAKDYNTKVNKQVTYMKRKTTQQMTTKLILGVIARKIVSLQNKQHKKKIELYHEKQVHGSSSQEDGSDDEAFSNCLPDQLLELAQFPLNSNGSKATINTPVRRKYKTSSLHVSKIFSVGVRSDEFCLGETLGQNLGETRGQSHVQTLGSTLAARKIKNLPIHKLRTARKRCDFQAKHVGIAFGSKKPTHLHTPQKKKTSTYSFRRLRSPSIQNDSVKVGSLSSDSATKFRFIVELSPDEILEVRRRRKYLWKEKQLLHLLSD